MVVSLITIFLWLSPGMMTASQACSARILQLENPLLGLNLAGQAIEELEATYEESIGRLFEASQINHRTLFDDWNLSLSDSKRRQIALNLQRTSYRSILIKLSSNTSYWELLLWMETEKIPDKEKALLLGISAQAVFEILNVERKKAWIYFRNHRWTRAELITYFYLRGFKPDQIAIEINRIAQANVTTVGEVEVKLGRLGLDRANPSWRGTWDEGYIIYSHSVVWPNFGFYWSSLEEPWTLREHRNTEVWQRHRENLKLLDAVLDHFLKIDGDLSSNSLSKEAGWKGLSRSRLNEVFGGGDSFWVALIKRSQMLGLPLNFLRMRMREGSVGHRVLKKEMMLNRLLDLLHSGRSWAEIRKMKPQELGFELRAFLGVEVYAKGKPAHQAALHSGPREAYVALYKAGLDRGMKLFILDFHAEDYFTEEFRSIAQDQIIEYILQRSMETGTIPSFDELAEKLSIPKQQILGYKRDGFEGAHPNHIFPSTEALYNRLEREFMEDPRLSPSESGELLRILTGRRHISQPRQQIPTSP